MTKRLLREKSLASQWTDDASIQTVIAQLFHDHGQLEIVIAGWVDQTVLEYHAIVQGDESCLAGLLSQLDNYRPDEHGDICFYLADLNYQQVFATTSLSRTKRSAPRSSKSGAIMFWSTNSRSVSGRLQSELHVTLRA